MASSNSLSGESKKQVLVIQNEANEGLGTIEDELACQNLEFVVVRVFDGEEVGRNIGYYNDRFDCNFRYLIVLGGTASVVGSIDSKEGSLNDTISLIKDCFKEDVAVLGVCLGAQMMAKALGAKVYQGDVGEFGWCDVEITKEGLEDKFFSVFKSKEIFFQLHGDTFDFSHINFGDKDIKVVHLAESKSFKNQAFKFVSTGGISSYGLQFHLEVDSEMVRDWTEVIKKDVKKSNLQGFNQVSAEQESRTLTDSGRNSKFLSMFLGS